MPLSNLEPWRYFEDPDEPDDEEAALVILRARLGEDYETEPADAVLTASLARAVSMLERYTSRFFVVRQGTLKLDGTGVRHLWLPFPVVSVDQGGDGVTEVVVDGADPIDEDLFEVNDGAFDGPGDPRQNPYILGPKWRAGVQNVEVTATWGYVEPDGSTPELILHALARLVVLNTDAPGDPAASEISPGALVSEEVQGRKYTYSSAHGERATGAGLTLDREVDSILRSFRRPPEATIPNTRRQTRRTSPSPE